MLNKFAAIALILTVFLFFCSKLPHFSTCSDDMRCASAPSLMRPTKPVPLSRETYANDNGDIRLQNLKTRIIVICRESFYETAETCAQFYEKNNYVRLTDIPYKVAKYDRLTKDTFPTRRWRNGERTPRW